MTNVVQTTSRDLLAIETTFEQLRANMKALGLSLSVWDDLGRCVLNCEGVCEFCEFICGQDEQHIEEARELARRIVADGKPAQSRSPHGCCVLGEPVYQRRRLIGAAVVCFPVREMLDEAFLADLCDRQQLDRQVVEQRAREACRHSIAEADDFLRLLHWTITREQKVQTASGELVTLSNNLASTYEELSLIYRISGSMKVTRQPPEFLQNICDELMEILSISAVAGLIYANPSSADDDLVVLSGGMGLDENEIKLLVDAHVAPRLAQTRSAMVENSFATEHCPPAGAIKNLIAVPLVTDDNTIGVLIGFNKLAEDFDSVDLKLINAIGNQAAVFLTNSRLYADLQDLLMGVLHALTATIDAKDPYTCGHSQRVALISRHLAEMCDFPPTKVREIYLSGLLHDIGKIGVPEATLRKPGRLTDEEFEGLKCHPMLGAKILGGIRQLDAMITGILTHHEHLDGKGYPQGLSGRQIPIEGLIVGLADSLDAMTSDRTYRNALPIDVAIREIRSNTGTQFDEDLADKLLSLDLEMFLKEISLPAETVFPTSIVQEAAR